jgi:hypothetical protein
MGDYLTTPKKEKETSDGESQRVLPAFIFGLAQVCQL